jgi:hypothetical protein
MVVTAVVSDKTKETYQWILECLLSATDNTVLKVLFTNADPRWFQLFMKRCRQQSIIIAFGTFAKS